MAKFRYGIYTGLRTELQICKIGGLFLAIYKDRDIAELLINSLKADLPEQFIFQIKMDPQKVAFPTFFEQTFEQIGSKSNIFHITGIEGLPEDIQLNFINYLQYTRERFKAKPYSLVFWITSDFEKKLFHSAPDFYHWISGIYDFSDFDLQVDGRHLSRAEYSVSPQMLSQQFTKYLKKVVWQYEHWQEVKENGEKFLTDGMERANLSEYYVSTYCIDKDGETRLLDDILENFLSDNSKHFLTLLGDFGTGKSTFALYFFIVLARRYLLSKKGRIPIFVSLKNYPGELDLEQFVSKEFYKKFAIITINRWTSLFSNCPC